MQVTARLQQPVTRPDTPNSPHQVAKLNELTSGTPLEKKSIEELIRTRAKIPAGVFNAAAQTWNHDFYWKVASNLLSEL